MSSLTFYRRVIDETGQTNREAVKRGTAAVFTRCGIGSLERRLDRQSRSFRVISRSCGKTVMPPDASPSS
jgi:hypothetical protein